MAVILKIYALNIRHFSSFLKNEIPNFIDKSHSDATNENNIAKQKDDTKSFDISSDSLCCLLMLRYSSNRCII
jgi:hypothetical protein